MKQWITRFQSMPISLRIAIATGFVLLCGLLVSYLAPSGVATGTNLVGKESPAPGRSSHHPPPDTPFMVAAANGDAKAIEHLLQVGDEDASHINKHGFSALIWATVGGHLRCVQLLIPYSHINPPPGRHTAIRAAAINGRADIAHALIDNNADVNIPSAGDRTALMGAAKGGHMELVKLLLDHRADVRKNNTFNETALDLAKTDQMRTLLRDAFAPSITPSQSPP